MEPIFDLAQILIRMVVYFFVFEQCIIGFTGWKDFPSKKKRMHMYVASLLLVALHNLHF